MSVLEDWKEVQELNNLPLNQLAKQALKMLKQEPDSSDLYLLQLIRYCLDSGRVRFLDESPQQRTQKYVMREYLDVFYTWSPARVMQVFLENSNQEPLEIYPPGPVHPTMLVQAALDQLHSRLTAAQRDYPVAKPE